jgi:hypothetical protein
MFMVTEADAAAIRDIFEKDGELSAAIELRRRFPGIVDNAKARDCVRESVKRPGRNKPARVAAPMDEGAHMRSS